MLFCKKCGGLLAPKVEGNKKILVCVKCGAKYENENSLIVSEKTNKKVEVIDTSSAKMVTATIVEAKCPKCGNKKAYFWMEQTRAADEPPTKIYKCTKCGYVWREYQ